MGIKELIDKVRAAAGPDRELDNDIYRWLHPEYAGFVEGRGGLVHPNDGEDQRVLSNVRSPNYTASIDSALALVGRCLPGWRFALYTNGGGKGPACLAMVGDDPVKADVHAPTLPLAIILALLTALDKKEENK